jgi:hypothetical protein
VSGERIKVLTGNDLLTGDVIWWTGSAWSKAVDDAAAVGDDAETIAAAEQDARRVVGAYAIDATRDDRGVRPSHIKERIRALGPTVRLDLTLRPDDPAAVAWIA